MNETLVHLRLFLADVQQDSTLLSLLDSLAKSYWIVSDKIQMLPHYFDNPVTFFASIVATKIVAASQQLDWSVQRLEPNLPCFVIDFKNLVWVTPLPHLTNLEMLDSSGIKLILDLTDHLMAQPLLPHWGLFIYSLKLDLLPLGFLDLWYASV